MPTTIKPDYVYLLQLSGPAPVRVLVVSVDATTVTYHKEDGRGRYHVRQAALVTSPGAFLRRTLREAGRVLPDDLEF